MIEYAIVLVWIALKYLQVSHALSIRGFWDAILVSRDDKNYTVTEHIKHKNLNPILPLILSHFGASLLIICNYKALAKVTITFQN